jgi:hypothetical protein
MSISSCALSSSCAAACTSLSETFVCGLSPLFPRPPKHTNTYSLSVSLSLSLSLSLSHTHTHTLTHTHTHTHTHARTHTHTHTSRSQAVFWRGTNEANVRGLGPTVTVDAGVSHVSNDVSQILHSPERDHHHNPHHIITTPIKSSQPPSRHLTPLQAEHKHASSTRESLHPSTLRQHFASKRAYRILSPATRTLPEHTPPRARLSTQRHADVPERRGPLHWPSM